MLTILEAVVGSKCHGVGTGDDDLDIMGVCIEPPEYVIGLRHFEQTISRTQPEGVRSGPGDVDRCIYSLRKWCRLALKGNPSILALLFATPSHAHRLGNELQQMAWAFASRSAGNAFLGYMTSQRMRLVGERGQKRVRRPELEERYGFDSKYAGHIIRLGYQGIEFLTTGRITLPMPEEERERVLAVREGRMTLNDTLTLAGELEAILKDLMDLSPLPLRPYHSAVDKFLIRAYNEAWSEFPVGVPEKPYPPAPEPLPA